MPSTDEIRRDARSHLIDGLRIYVCVLIMVSHLGIGALVSPNLQMLISSGLGSGIFFVLAGFVACLSLSFWERSWYDSIVTRVSRLYPLHLLSMLPFLPFALFGVERVQTWDEFVSLAAWLTGLQALDREMAYFSHFNGPAWCVTAFLVGGILLPSLKQFDIRSRQTSTIVRWLVAMFVLDFAFDVLLPLPRVGLEPFRRHIAVFPRVVEIFAGGFAAVLVVKHRDASPLRHLSTDAAFLAALALPFGACALAGDWFGPPGAFYFAHGYLLPCAILLLATAYLNRGRLNAWCSHPLVRHWSQLSILVYFFHFPIYTSLRLTREAFHLPHTALATWVIAIATIVLTAWFAEFLWPLTTQLELVFERLMRAPLSKALPPHYFQPRWYEASRVTPR